MNDTHYFKARARVIEQLGFQLIKSESIALLELVKNAYDADANLCQIVMNKIDKPEEAEIIIQDDGEGMDKNILSHAWLEIGTNYKEELLKNKETNITTKYGRRRLGEKGIGRLGIHRLGKEIEIITRKENKKEYILTLNWDDIEESNYLENIPVNVKDRKPVIFINNSGTLIKIRGLRTPWTRKMVRDCYRAVLSLNSPFEYMDSFKVDFSIDKKEWLAGLLSYNEIEMYKLFSFAAEMKGNNIIKFKYQFIPWDTMNKLQPRKITIEDKEIKNLTRMVYKEGKRNVDINLGNYKIGIIKFEGIIFDRDTRIMDLGVQDKRGLKEYLDENGGIRVYRDNMRVLDYGEPGNDWLDLGGRRVNMPTKRISNNIILGAVYLKREKSNDLKEKANREGFIENEAYIEFLRSVLYVLDRVESLRKSDKDLLRKFYGDEKVNEPVITSVSDLKAVIEKKVKQEKLKNEIINYLDRITIEYKQMTENLLKSAGAGINLIMVVHEMEKIIKIIRSLIDKKVNIEQIKKQIEKLAALIEGYSILIRKSEIKPRNARKILDNTVALLESRFERHHINVVKAYKPDNKLYDVLYSEDHITSALLNVFDNAIYWLDYAKTQEPQIYLDISDNFPGYRSIVIADNGPGFSLPVTEIVKPFVSDKPDGMGIGLHLTEQIMTVLGGKLFFPEADEYFDFPPVFKKGAKLALLLKKGE